MIQIALITLQRITEKAVLVQVLLLAALIAYIGLEVESGILPTPGNVEQNGVGVVFLFLGAFTLFWSTIEIPREISRQEAHVYLTKPLSRLRYLLGKVLGMTAMTRASQAFLLAVLAGCMFAKGRPPTEWFYFAAAKTALFLLFLNTVCASISTLLPEIPALVGVIVLVLIGVFTFVLPVLAWSSFDKSSAWGLMAAYFPLPNLLHYRWEPPVEKAREYLMGLTLYTLGWSTLGLLVAHTFFRKRDLN